ncbi:MAG: hypothetical protein ACQERF_09125 [Actinomycetota bacterium]
MSADPTRESLEAIAAEKAFFEGRDHARIAEIADKLDLDSLAALDRLAAHLAKRAIRQASLTDQLLEDGDALAATASAALATVSQALTARAVYIDTVLSRPDLEDGPFEG